MVFVWYEYCFASQDLTGVHKRRLCLAQRGNRDKRMWTNIINEVKEIQVGVKALLPQCLGSCVHLKMASKKCNITSCYYPINKLIRMCVCLCELVKRCLVLQFAGEVRPCRPANGNSCSGKQIEMGEWYCNPKGKDANSVRVRTAQPIVTVIRQNRLKWENGVELIKMMMHILFAYIPKHRLEPFRTRFLLKNEPYHVSRDDEPRGLRYAGQAWQVYPFFTTSTRFLDPDLKKIQRISTGKYQPN